MQIQEGPDKQNKNIQGVQTCMLSKLDNEEFF
jgi:hypothetical protein